MTKLPLAIGLVLLQAAVLARGQTTPAESTLKPVPERPALAGPAVERAEPRTLVVYEYGGGLQELGLPAPEAALELLDLDHATAERVQRVLTERSMLAEQLIIDNFDLVSQAETVEASENGLAKGLFFLQVLRALEPLIDRGPLEDEIRAELPTEPAAEFDRLLDEYWEAVGRSRVQAARERGEKLSLRRAVREARRDQLGRETELAAARALESERFAVDYLTRGLDLSPEQEALIDRLVRDFAGRTMMGGDGQASEEEKQQLVVQVLAFLNERQRDLMIERINGL